MQYSEYKMFLKINNKIYIFSNKLKLKFAVTFAVTLLFKYHHIRVNLSCYHSCRCFEVPPFWILYRTSPQNVQAVSRRAMSESLAFTVHSFECLQSDQSIGPSDICLIQAWGILWNELHVRNISVLTVNAIVWKFSS
jgi:hypothetical protein